MAPSTQLRQRLLIAAQHPALLLLFNNENWFLARPLPLSQMISVGCCQVTKF